MYNAFIINYKITTKTTRFTDLQNVINTNQNNNTFKIINEKLDYYNKSQINKFCKKIFYNLTIYSISLRKKSQYLSNVQSSFVRVLFSIRYKVLSLMFSITYSS